MRRPAVEPAYNGVSMLAPLPSFPTMKTRLFRTAVILLGLGFGLFSCAGENARTDGHGPRVHPLYAMDTCTKTRYPASDTSVEQQLDLLHRLGYAGISWTAEDPARLEAAAHAAAERGVPVFAVYCHAELTRDQLKADPRLPAIMRALKGQNTILWLYVTSGAFKPSDARGDAVAAPELRRIADLAAEHGLRVAIYPHAGAWAERVGDAVRLAKQVDRGNFGVTFNLCHTLRAGEEARIPDLLREAAPHLFVVTLNGADSGAATASWNRLIRPLDEGTYDTGAFLRELDKVGFDGPVALQGYGITLPPEENLSRSMKAWRALGQAAPEAQRINPASR